MFFLTQAAVPHLSKGDAIVNTTSVTAYRGSVILLITQQRKVLLCRSHVLLQHH